MLQKLPPIFEEKPKEEKQYKDVLALRIEVP